jgi:hypothetical protein
VQLVYLKAYDTHYEFKYLPTLTTPKMVVDPWPDRFIYLCAVYLTTLFHQLRDCIASDEVMVSEP